MPGREYWVKGLGIMVSDTALDCFERFDPEVRSAILSMSEDLQRMAMMAIGHDPERARAACGEGVEIAAGGVRFRLRESPDGVELVESGERFEANYYGQMQFHQRLQTL